MNYVDYIKSRLPAKPFKGRLGERLSGLVGGLVANIIAQGASYAVQAVWLVVGQPDDVLPYQGADKRLRRYIAETAAAYRARLETAFEIWDSGGTEACLEGQLEAAGYEGAEIHSPRDWGRSPLNHITQFWAYLPFESHRNGGLFFLCNGGQLCGAEGVVCGADSDFKPGALAGSGLAVAGEHTAGIRAPIERITELRYIAKTFKAGHEVCRQIIVEIDGPICGTGLESGLIDDGGSSALCGGTTALIGTGVLEE